MSFGGLWIHISRHTRKFTGKHKKTKRNTQGNKREYTRKQKEIHKEPRRIHTETKGNTHGNKREYTRKQKEIHTETKGNKHGNTGEYTRNQKEIHT